LSRCAWKSLKTFFQTIVPEEDAVPGSVIAIQTFRDLLGFNPHCHVLYTDVGFYGKGMFRVAPWFIPRELEKLFRHKAKCSSPERRPRKIWSRIQPGEEEAMENLTRYIIRVSFSRERMTYVPD
jgi:hypothetical protein